MNLVLAANEINLLHEKASNSAAEAIGYAKEAGMRLLAAKESLPHGQFGPWVKENLTVSHRQAQRYITAYKGKKVKTSALPEYDTMSHLERQHFLNRLKNPQWIPEEGTWYSVGLDIGGFWVVPDSKFSGAFHISKFSAPPGIDTSRTDIEWLPLYRCTQRSVDADKVDATLIFFGLPNPEKLDWQTYKAPGQSLPFGQFEDHAQ